jgi:hypothetical protein
LERPRQPSPEDAIFPRTDDMRPLAGGVRSQYRALREIAADKGSPYRPVGKAKLITCPIATPPRLYRPAREEIAHGWLLTGSRGRSLEATSPRNIVLPGKPHCLLCEISYPGFIVPPGKRYRPCEETLSSCTGTNIVLPGNPYRPLWELISSHRGKVIVPLRKCTWLFPANMSFILRARSGCPVIVYVKCLLCVFGKNGF